MNVEFSDEQLALRDLARDLFQRENPPSRVRAILDGADADDKLWRTLEEVGLLDEMSLEDVVLVLEEAGRAALPEPLAEHHGGDQPAAAHAAVLNGVSARVLEMTTSYVKERKQFGKPIGSFQAVKHKLASVLIALEQARAASHHAAYAVARSLPDAHVSGSAAVVSAHEAHMLANTEALQCHGGIGFTWEHDLHLWLKYGLSVADRLDAPAHRARLAEAAISAAREAR